MIEAVIKQDLEELSNYVRSLHEKYGRDFHFFGEYGIEGDEINNETPVYGAFIMVGNDRSIHRGLHNILDKEVGVEALMIALRCKCRHELPSKTEFTSDLRDKVLSLIQKELEKIAREEEAEEDVDSFLKSAGFKQ